MTQVDFIKVGEKEITPEYVLEMEKLLAKKEEDIKSVVGELTSDRAKRQQLEAERDILKIELDKLKASGKKEETVEETVTRILSKELEKTVEQNRISAEEKFKNANKEFHPENDPGGLKFAAFKKKLEIFNLNGLKTEEQFSEVFNNALIIMNRKESSGDDYTPQIENRDNESIIKQVNKSQLTPKEVKLIKELGWTEERYLKQKASRPKYVENLLAHKSN